MGRILRPVHRSGEGGFWQSRPEGRHACDDRLLVEARSPSVAFLHSLCHRRALARSRIWLWQHSICRLACRLRRPRPEPKAESVFRAVTLARTLRANYNLPSNRRLRWLVQTQNDWVKAELAVLGVLLNAESIESVDVQPAGAAACPTEIGVIFLPLERRCRSRDRAEATGNRDGQSAGGNGQGRAQACLRVLCS